jgi:hypothetical protein
VGGPDRTLDRQLFNAVLTQTLVKCSDLTSFQATMASKLQIVVGPGDVVRQDVIP